MKTLLPSLEVQFKGHWLRADANACARSLGLHALAWHRSEDYNYLRIATFDIAHATRLVEEWLLDNKKEALIVPIEGAEELDFLAEAFKAR